MSKIELDQIGPDYLRADLNNTMQLHNIIECVVGQLGVSKVTVVTFSVSEEFIRKIWMLRNKKMIDSIILILDFKAAQKIKKIMKLCANVFDQIHYCKIHAKVVILDAAKFSVCVTGSQNATRGNRTESILITTREEIIIPFREKIKDLKTVEL
ncbi:MAG: hypothetical protein PHU68_05960 [Paludibacter sp.]|nr:hypothetical protein [Paludibacter sp.]